MTWAFSDALGRSLTLVSKSIIYFFASCCLEYSQWNQTLMAVRGHSAAQGTVHSWSHCRSKRPFGIGTQEMMLLIVANNVITTRSEIRGDHQMSVACVKCFQVMILVLGVLMACQIAKALNNFSGEKKWHLLTCTLEMAHTCTLCDLCVLRNQDTPIPRLLSWLELLIYVSRC